MKALIDFIPMLVFFYLYKSTDPHNATHPLLQLIKATGGADNNHILVATTGLIIAVIVVYGFLFFRQKFHLDKQQWLILLMTVFFGGMTIILSDDFYIRLKAVLINLAFAAGFALSPLLFGKDPIVKKILGQLLALSPQGWLKLNYAWAGMFVLMAGLHGFFAFVFMGGRYWGEFTAFGDMLVMLAFSIANMVILRKYLIR